MRYSLDLFSNFTFFLDDTDNGDQFRRCRDRRCVDANCPVGGGGDGVNDIHFHPIEPRQLRLTVSAQF